MRLTGVWIVRLLRRIAEARSRAELCRVPLPTGVWVQNSAAAEVNDCRRRGGRSSVSVPASGRVLGAGLPIGVGSDPLIVSSSLPVSWFLVVSDGAVGDWFSLVSGAGSAVGLCWTGVDEVGAGAGDATGSGPVALHGSGSGLVIAAEAVVAACLWAGPEPGVVAAAGSVAGSVIGTGLST